MVIVVMMVLMCVDVWLYAVCDMTTVCGAMIRLCVCIHPQTSVSRVFIIIICVSVIQVLSRLSSIRILGDWTPRHESMGLDTVLVYNTKGQFPVCASIKPDASICTC